MYGLSEPEYYNVPDTYTDLSILTELNLGTIPFKILNTTDRSPGNESDIQKLTGTDPVLIAGDALFEGFIVRTDLPGRNHKHLIASIKTQLLPLLPNTKVFPVHGSSMIIQEDVTNNPFLI